MMAHKHVHPPDARIIKARYALGLSRLIGRMILLLTATGRKSGLPRVTPLQYQQIDFIYRLWAPVYDRAFTRLFAAGRRQAIAALAPQPGERLLLAGIGTGADLPLLPAGVRVVGVDRSSAMLAHARARQARGNADVLLIQADAQALPLRDGVCDAALLNLIVSVVPDGGACLREAVRALQPSGRIVIFDKFLPDHARLGIIRRLLNGGAHCFGTDINRRLSDILAGSGCVVEDNMPSLARGVYRVVVVKPLFPA